MMDRSNGRGRSLMLSASAAAMLALAAGTAQADCAAEIEALLQEVETAETMQPPAAGERQQAMAEPRQQRGETAEQQQPSPDERQEAMGGQDLLAGVVRQHGMLRPGQQASPGELQAVRPPAGAAIGEPGATGGGAPAAGMARPGPGGEPDRMAALGAQQGDAGSDQPTERQESAAEGMADGQPSASHPLVLLMADGSVVDLRPPEERGEGGGEQADAAAEADRQQAPAADAERAEADVDSSRQQAATPEPDESVDAEALLADARAALQLGDEETCMEAVEQARAAMAR